MLSRQQQWAIKEAQKGNWKPADRMELQFLNEHIQPSYPNGEPYYLTADTEEHWHAIKLLRHHLPGFQIAIQWRNNDLDEILTDIDGVVLEEYLDD